MSLAALKFTISKDGSPRGSYCLQDAPESAPILLSSMFHDCAVVPVFGSGSSVSNAKAHD
jgi:hypothetical protein